MSMNSIVEEMNNDDGYYFTFMYKQKEHNRYVHIKGDYGEARKQMVARFGDQWAMQYSANQWFDKDGKSQAELYNLKEI